MHFNKRCIGPITQKLLSVNIAQKVFIQMKTDDAPAFAEGIWLKRQENSLNWAFNPNGNELLKEVYDVWSSGAWESEEIMRVACLIILCLQGEREFVCC